MKRRNFLTGIAATVGAAAVPAPILANVAKVAVSSKHRLAGFHYGWAVVFAQMNDGITITDVADKFRISNEDAQKLFDRMYLRGVLHPPGLDGRSHATRPWQPWDKKKAMANREAKERNRNASQRDRSRSKAAFDRVMAHVTTHATFGWT